MKLSREDADVDSVIRKEKKDQERKKKKAEVISKQKRKSDEAIKDLFHKGTHKGDAYNITLF